MYVFLWQKSKTIEYQIAIAQFLDAFVRLKPSSKPIAAHPFLPEA